MKSKKEIAALLSMTTKQKEKELGIKIRNGQCTMGIKAACKWIIQENNAKTK